MEMANNNPVVVELEYIYEPYVFSHSEATSAECNNLVAKMAIFIPTAHLLCYFFDTSCCQSCWNEPHLMTLSFEYLQYLLLNLCTVNTTVQHTYTWQYLFLA